MIAFPRGFFRGCRLRSGWPAALVILAVLACGSAAQSLPGLSKPVSPEAAADDFSDPEAILQRVEAFNREIDSMPEGTDPELLDILGRARAAAEYHLNTAKFAEAARKSLDEARRETRTWSGFEQNPPYSLLLQDELRDKLVPLWS